MTINNPTTILALERQADGSNDSTWGSRTNANFNRLEAAIAGSVSIAVTTLDVTLTTSDSTDTASDMQSRYAAFTFTGTLTGNRNVIVPAVSKIFFVYNNTSGAYSLTVKTSGGTGIAVPQGTRAILYCDATNVVDALSAYATLASPALTGNPTAPTQTANNNSTRVATTAYVDTADALKANAASPTFTGTVVLPATVNGTASADLNITAGAAASVTSAGQAVTVTGGAGGGTSGSGGAVTITTGGTTDGVAGTLTLSAANSTGTNRAGGAINVTAGRATGSATGGAVTITAGAASNSSGTGTGGAVSITAGAGGSTSGSGGAVTISAGASTTSGAGAAVNLTAAAGVGTNMAGGAVVLTPGASTGTGVPGAIQLAGQYVEKMVARQNTGSSITLAATANVQLLTLSAATPAITLPPINAISNTSQTILVSLLQDATGSRVPTWAGSGSDTISWDASASAPAPVATASKETLYSFVSFQGSTVWRGAKVWSQN